MNSDGKDGAKCLADGLGAAEGVHGLHLRVPAFDAVVEVDGEDADVDGFDDVLVELLEALELADFLFQAGVEAGVLEGDADVAGQGFEQLDVFAGQEVAAQGAAQADDGDGAAGGLAVFELHPGPRGKADSSSGRAAPRCAAGLRGRCRAACAFSRKMWEWSLARSKSRKPRARLFCAALDLVGQAVGGGQAQAARSSCARKTATRATRSVRGNCSTMESSSAWRSVSELRPRPNSTSALR